MSTYFTFLLLFCVSLLWMTTKINAMFTFLLQVHADSLRHSLLRINTYRALASPAWISLTSPDPILTAFQLSWELERLALRENEFKDSYIKLSDQCKKYACDLLEQCRSSDEVIAVLNKVSFNLIHLEKREIISDLGTCQWDQKVTGSIPVSSSTAAVRGIDYTLYIIEYSLW